MLAPPLCLCCRGPLARAARGPGLCGRCILAIELARPQRLAAAALDDGFAPLPYEGVGRRLVGALKFQRLLLVAELGAALIVAGAPAGMLGGEIVPVPPSSLRLARRGFDPAAELSGALAGAGGLNVSPCLRRLDARPQRGRSRQRRLSAPPRFAAAAIVPGRALLVDDVATTGHAQRVCCGAATSGLPPDRGGDARGRASAGLDPGERSEVRIACPDGITPSNDRSKHADRDRRPRHER